MQYTSKHRLCDTTKATCQGRPLKPLVLSLLQMKNQLADNCLLKVQAACIADGLVHIH